MIDALLLHALVWLLLPLLHPSANGEAASPPARFAVDLLDPAPVAVPGKAVVDYRVRAIAGISSADGVAVTDGADRGMLVEISVDGRVLAYQSLAQCLAGPCWLPLSRYPLATLTGEHVLRVHVVHRDAAPPHALQPLSVTARHTYTIARADLDRETSDNFMKWWHEEAAVWTTVKWLGVATQKLPLDMWSYQEVISSLHPSVVVETGTRIGGSALYFATVLNANPAGGSPLFGSDVCGGPRAGNACPTPFVLTIDIAHADVDSRVRSEPSIELLEGSSTGAVVRRRLDALFRDPERPRDPKSRVFVILDSDHRSQHVSNELELFAEILRAGDYVVVEDGIVNGHPVEPGWGDGPFEAIEAFEAAYGKGTYFLHDTDREKKFGMTAAPNGFLIRTLVPWGRGGL